MKFLILFLLPLCIYAQRPNLNTDKKDASWGSFFLQGNILFLNFEKRNLFEEELEAQREEKISTLDESNTRQDSLNIKTIKYQKVNLTFPIGGGALWRVGKQYFGFGFLYLYNKENAVLINGTSKEELSYTLRSWPAYLEWKALIPPSILLLDKGEFLYISLRYYWLLRQSSIDYNNKTIHSSFSSTGNGWGAHLGYQFAEWRNFRVTGELGYTSIQTQSEEKWNTLLPSSKNTSKAQWDVGGVQSSLKIHWHFGHPPALKKANAPQEEPQTKPILPKNATSPSL